MGNRITRRSFLKKNICLGLASTIPEYYTLDYLSKDNINNQGTDTVPLIMTGRRQLFADDVMLAYTLGIQRKCHPAGKQDHPVLEPDKSWEYVEQEGVKYPYASVYGTVLRDDITGLFRMWYNVNKKICYAESSDGMNWHKPELGQLGPNNIINLFDFHSPSIILDIKDTDPGKRYKAIGSKEGFSKEGISRLKSKFSSSEWYTRRHAYSAAYSPDGLEWTMYPEPVLLGMDTITLAQDPLNGEYLAFHKQTQDPRSFGRQIFLSFSRDMQSWSDTELAMATDETDHEEARKLQGGTHSEIYNMSAFYYESQWLGLITLFRCIGEPLVNGKAQPGQKGIIDARLVHSRDGRTWHRCSDRSPVIPTGPHKYDAGLVYGVCNTPVIIGDEMWIYYAASTDIHCGTDPGKRVSIGHASWRIDGMVSLQAGETEGIIETVLLTPQGKKLSVNADVSKGQLLAEILDENGKVIRGYEKQNSIPLFKNAVCQYVHWKNKETLPRHRIFRLRFYLINGDLYSYKIE